jgi:hypothetical protein
VSWGFYLMPDTSDPGEWISFREDPLPGRLQPTDGDAAAKHADLIQARWPSFGPERKREDGAIALCGPDPSGLPIVVGLEGHYASIDVAEWDTIGRREEIADLLVDLATALAERTGWVIFDGERVLDAEGLRRQFLKRQEVELGFFRDPEAEPAPRRRKFLGLF